ncbi:MAG: transcription antitermination factor NusB [Candidatus Nanopelagicales bacterium]
MSARSKARKRALDVLFESDVRGTSALDSLTALEGRADFEINPYTAEIVNGVVDNRERIDELMETYSSGWSVARMPRVDRNVLRIGTWELIWADDVPDGVAISEAVELASDLSTDDSGRFVNGLLSKIAEVKEHIVID